MAELIARAEDEHATRWAERRAELQTRIDVLKEKVRLAIGRGNHTTVQPALRSRVE